MKIVVAGDFCDTGRIRDRILENDYATLFGGVKPCLEGVDASIVNFEFPIVIKEERAIPIQKCGPNLRGQIRSIDAISFAGFNICTLANNHIMDQGRFCCCETKMKLEEAGIKTVGVGNNLKEASEIVFVQNRKETLALINCCEHEYSIASETTAGANPLNPVQQFYKIQEARLEANYVLVIVHGGHEHYNLPSPRMQETYRFFIDSGADAVVNHHQHCFSGFEIYKGKPIFYGIGNFCFDKLYDGLPDSWHEGFMVEFDFEIGENAYYKLIPYVQCKDTPSVVLMNGEEQKSFLNEISKLNKIILDPVLLKAKHEEWMEKNGGGFECQFLPYRNRLLLSAYRRNLFPSFISREKLLLLQNHFECESHRERSMFALCRLLENK